jgi:hypothetical protein
MAILRIVFCCVLFLVILQGQIFSGALVKTGTGLLYGDNFNLPALNTNIWVVTHVGPEYGTQMVFKDGWVEFSGTPTDALGWRHFGLFANNADAMWDSRNAVMAGRMRIPVWSDTCWPLGGPNKWQNTDTKLEFHFCNRGPDINTSIGIIRNCKSAYTENVPPHIGSCTPPPDIIRQGFGLFISYNDMHAEHYLVLGDSTVNIGGQDVNLENGKRIEIKSIAHETGVYIEYHYDWTCVYLQPLDFPVVINVESPGSLNPDNRIRITYGNGETTEAGHTNGKFELMLKEEQIYPVAATVSLQDGNGSLIGSETVNYDGELEGLYPGDTFSLNLNTLAKGLSESGHFRSGMVDVYPNPVTGTAILTFNLPENGFSFGIYNSRGKMIRTIKPGKGTSSITWHPAGYSGNRLPSGVYFIRARIDNRNFFKRFLILQ